MNRRLFFKRSCAGALLLSCPGLLARENEKRQRFGLVTDIHFAHRNVHGTRYYEQSITKLSEAIDVFNRRKLDFMIELGDLKDMGDIPERGQTLSFLDEIEAKFQTFDGPVYHVLGNHDMDSISKSEFLAHTSNYGSAKGKPYYSFVRNQIKFIDKELCIGNAEEIVSILEQSGKVVAVIQGHHHAGNYSFRHGIHYFTMKGMIEGSLPENNSFAVIEIDKDLNIYIEGFYNCKNKEMKHNR